MYRKYFIVILSSLFIVTGCGFVPAPTNVQSGRAIIVSNVVEGEEARNIIREENYSKRGKACTTNYFYLVNVGNSSIKTAKKDGEITTVQYIERTKSGLGIWFILPFIYSTACTVVYGE